MAFKHSKSGVDEVGRELLSLSHRKLTFLLTAMG